MGVSGSGKTTLANLIAKELGGVRVLEGDTLHSYETREKMRAGVALTDEDRWPWLDRIHQALIELGDQSVIVTCSALKRVYRERLTKGIEGDLMFVFLDAPRELIAQRLALRQHEYMPPSLLDSQLQTLEPPQDDEPAVRVSVESDAGQSCQEILRLLRARGA
jgi:gluconokinase